MRLFTKEELIETMKEIFSEGWHKSVKRTIDTRNDGAVGNTLERLLGIKENNLPIPNAREWELKGQRLRTSSLITLKHIDPSPQAARIVSTVLLPNYGWKHKEAGRKYPRSEMSFRSTTSALHFTNRGFKIIVDRITKRIVFVFNYREVDTSDPEIATWLETVKQRAGLDEIIPEPYWGFDDLEPVIATKMKNCFYAVADTKREDGQEWFEYQQLYKLSGFSFERFINDIENGNVFVDFDARSGHNHGTKFRLKQNSWATLYSEIERVI